LKYNLLDQLEGRHAQLAAEFQAYSASEHSQVEMALNAAVSFGERVAALEVTVKQHHAAQAMQNVQEGHVSESTIMTLMQSAQSHADEQANAVFTQLSEKIQQTQADIAADVDANLNEMKENMSQTDSQLHQTMSRVAEMGQALHAQQQVSAALSDLVASFQSKLVELSSFLQSFEADQAEAESQRTTLLKQDIMSQVDIIIGEQSSMFSAKFDGVAEACQAGLMQLQQQMHDSIQVFCSIFLVLYCHTRSFTILFMFRDLPPSSSPCCPIRIPSFSRKSALSLPSLLLLVMPAPLSSRTCSM
jgi:chromosome segregation ATPase